MVDTKKLCVLCLKRRAVTTVCKLHVCFPCALRLGLTEANEAEKKFGRAPPPCPVCGTPTKILGVDINSDGEKAIHFACEGCYQLGQRKKEAPRC